ncbi:hypothetical protein RFI_12150, partial [Reticulomyxa filosa]
MANGKWQIGNEMKPSTIINNVSIVHSKSNEWIEQNKKQMTIARILKRCEKIYRQHVNKHRVMDSILQQPNSSKFVKMTATKPTTLSFAELARQYEATYHEILPFSVVMDTLSQRSLSQSRVKLVRRLKALYTGKKEKVEGPFYSSAILNKDYEGMKQRRKEWLKGWNENESSTYDNGNSYENDRDAIGAVDIIGYTCNGRSAWGYLQEQQSPILCDFFHKLTYLLLYCEKNHFIHESALAQKWEKHLYEPLPNLELAIANINTNTNANSNSNINNDFFYDETEAFSWDENDTWTNDSSNLKSKLEWKRVWKLCAGDSHAFRRMCVLWYVWDEFKLVFDPVHQSWMYTLREKRLQQLQQFMAANQEYTERDSSPYFNWKFQPYQKPWWATVPFSATATTAAVSKLFFFFFLFYSFINLLI